MKKKSVYQSLVVSNFVVLLVAIVVAVVSFRSYNRFSAAQAEDYNTVILRQIQEAFDEKMNSINKLMLNVSFDADVEMLHAAAKELTNEERYQSVKVMQSLDSYVTIYNNLVNSIALYYLSSDQVITNSCFYASSELFLKNSNSVYWPEDQWYQFFQDLDGGQQYYMNDEILTIITPLSYDRDVYMIFAIDGSFITDLIRNIRSLEDSLVAVSDNLTGEVLFSFGSSDLVQYAGRSEKFVLDRKQYSALTLPSQVNRWTYSFILTENAFIERAADLLTYSLVVLLILGGVVACLLLARWNFKPIQRTASVIAERMGVDIGPEGAKNELELIDEANRQAVSQYQNIKAVMNKYSLALRAKLLEQILKGILIPSQLTEEDHAVSGISFPHPDFYLVLLSIQPSGGQSASLSRQMGPLLIEYIDHLYSQETTGRAYGVELTLGRICVIANVSRYRKGVAEQLVREVAEYGYHSFGITITAAVGPCVDGADQLEAVYVQCVRGLEQQLIRYPGVTVFVDQLEPESSVYYYPLELESRLIDSVKAGNLKNVNEILDTVILENFINSSLTLEVSRCLFFNLMGTAIKVTSTLGYNNHELFGEDGDCYRRIISCNNIQDMEATLRQIFYTICAYINSSKQQGGQLIDKIVEHIRLNSADPNLSLLTVSSAFGMNPNYLSSYFKEQKGENFLTFLNSVRIKQACSLLQDTALGLEDIASKVGYSGSAVLIRNFKKSLGMTPGQYREKMKESAGN